MVNQLTMEMGLREILDKLEDQKQMIVRGHEKQDAIHREVKKTNGRVTELERTSIYHWAKRHPVRFILIIIGITLLLIAETRHMAVDLLLRFAGV